MTRISESNWSDAMLAKVLSDTAAADSDAMLAKVLSDTAAADSGVVGILLVTPRQAGLLSKAFDQALLAEVRPDHVSHDLKWLVGSIEADDARLRREMWFGLLLAAAVLLTALMVITAVLS